MIKILRKTIKDKTLSFPQEFLPGSWILVKEPTPEEVEILEKRLKIEKEEILGIQDPLELPRLDLIQDSIYIFLRFPFKEEERVRTLPILFVISPSFILTFAKDFKGIFDEFLEGKIEFYTTQRTKLFLLLCLKINQQFRVFINEIAKEIENLQTKLPHVEWEEFLKAGEKEVLISSILSYLISMSKVYEKSAFKRIPRIFKSRKGTLG